MRIKQVNQRQLTPADIAAIWQSAQTPAAPSNGIERGFMAIRTLAYCQSANHTGGTDVMDYRHAVKVSYRKPRTRFIDLDFTNMPTDGTTTH